MRIFFITVAFVALLGSCVFIGSKRVKGNGNVTVEERTGLTAKKIHLKGFMDVELTQGEGTTVKVEADENLQEYIITEMEGDELVVRMRGNINFITSEKLKVYITTAKLEQLKLSGSGNIVGMNKFTGSDRLKVSVSGVGDLRLETNTPELEAKISGSGSLVLLGETRDAKIQISGIGDCNAEELKAENASVKISGSGDVKIFADNKLDVSISGIGSVYYRGEAVVSQKVSGSGEVKRIQQ